MLIFSSSHFISYNSWHTLVLWADSMKKALTSSLQNTNMVFGSRFLDWSLQRRHNQASVVRWWRGKVLCLARGLLFHKVSGLAWPLCKTGDRFLWCRYIDGSSMTSLPCWLHLLNSWCTIGLSSQKHENHSPGKLAFRRLQGTALQINAHTVISRKVLFAQGCHTE